MKTFFCSFAVLLFSFCCKAQENNPFTIGFEKSTPSKILGEQRKVGYIFQTGIEKMKIQGKDFTL
jgi:hypothetical protein